MYSFYKKFTFNNHLYKNACFVFTKKVRALLYILHTLVCLFLNKKHMFTCSILNHNRYRILPFYSIENTLKYSPADRYRTLHHFFFRNRISNVYLFDLIEKQIIFNLPKAGPYSWTSVQFSNRLLTQSTCFFASWQNSAIFIVIVTGGNGHFWIRKKIFIQNKRRNSFCTLL
jgi:hypothetical protein